MFRRATMDKERDERHAIFLTKQDKLVACSIINRDRRWMIDWNWKSILSSLFSVLVGATEKEVRLNQLTEKLKNVPGIILKVFLHKVRRCDEEKRLFCLLNIESRAWGVGAYEENIYGQFRYRCFKAQNNKATMQSSVLSFLQNVSIFHSIKT